MGRSAKRVAVIGGGASGLVAACFAADAGAQVALFEKQKKLGRKILVTGNGRCNISNRAVDSSRYHGLNPAFVNNVFARFGPAETEDFFRSIGIPFVEGKDGKLFPASLQASTVVRCLEYEAVRRGAEIRLHRRIDAIGRKGDGFALRTAGAEEHSFDAVILAAGSCAYPPVGASRIGYELAASLGHRIVDCFPSIIPLNVVEKRTRLVQGIKWDCSLEVLMGGKKRAGSTGEVLFTGYGISGPAALDISRAVNELVTRGEIPEILVDFFPEMSADDLDELIAEVAADGSKPLDFCLAGIMNDRMPAVVCGFAGVDHGKNAGDASPAEKSALAACLKGMKLTPASPRDFTEAVVAAGGVDVRDIDPRTMESRLVPGLYITGELLDIDGDSGGFNLQFAWSTGALAGMSQQR